MARQYEVTVAGSGAEGLQRLSEFRPDLVLLDLSLGDVGGLEVCRQVKQRGDGVGVIVISGRATWREQDDALAAGADDFLRKPVDGPDLLARVTTHLRLHDALVGLNAARWEASNVTPSLAPAISYQVTDPQEVAVFSLATLAETCEADVIDHLIRVRAYAQILAEQLRVHGPYQDQIDVSFLQRLYRASPLHDLGKVGVPEVILLKPDRLSPNEFAKMQQHATIGANLLGQTAAHANESNFLAMAVEIARHHHERYDGSGYPAGLAGQDIPLSARLVALADVYDALTSRRPYKPALPAELAKRFILAERGEHFDPAVVDAFVACYEQFVQVRGDMVVEWEAQHGMVIS